MRKALVLFLSLALFLLVLPPAFSSRAVTAQEARAVAVEKMAVRLKNTGLSPKKVNRRLDRLVRRGTKAATPPLEVDFSDPVYKWLWFGVFGLGLALVMTIFIPGLGGLIALAAVVCLVVWLVKLNRAA